MSELVKIQSELKKTIPYKWRVQSFSKHKPQATCVAYVDSRDVQDVLDANCLWSDRYYEENGMLFCEITIYADGREYKRSDTGSESQADAKKGHSSDAFKRAAVKFGVGRFLYSLGVKYVTADSKKTSGNFPNVIDSSGKKVWDLTKHINNSNGGALNLPKVVIDGDVRLNKCKTIQELAAVYTSLSAAEKTKHAALKDKLKIKLTPKTA